jgi:lysophospholipase L1-like esterase
MYGSRSSRTTFAKITVAFVSTLVAILAAEGLARTLGVGASFGQLIFVRGVSTRMVDGVPLWDDKHPRCNREDIRRAATDRSAFKIIGLGDSIMYGVWQPKETTYLEETRRALAGRTKRTVEILNLAVPGYNTLQENAVYKEIADQIKPDLVLVHYWIDDVHQYRVVGGYVVDVGNISEDDGRLVVRALPVPPRVNDFLLVHSRLYDLVTQAVVAATRSPQLFDWTRVSRPLADIQERAQRAGARLVVLASPHLDRPSPAPNDDLPRLRQFAAARGIEVIDLSEWLRGVRSNDIALDACHFNAEGHRLIGERLAAYLLQHGLKE